MSKTFKDIFEKAQYNLSVHRHVLGHVMDTVGSKDAASGNAKMISHIKAMGTHKEIMTKLDSQYERARPGLSATNGGGDRRDTQWHHRNHIITLHNYGEKSDHHAVFVKKRQDDKAKNGKQLVAGGQRLMGS